MAEGQDSSKKINLTVKTPKEKQTVEVEENASIKDVCISVCMFSLVLHVLLYFVTHQVDDEASCSSGRK
jgi:hypothetical protein